VKLRIEDVTSEVKHIAFTHPEDEINSLLTQGPAQDYRIEGAVAVQLSYYRSGADLIFEGVLHAPALGVCGRCAESFHAVNHRQFRFVIVPASPAGVGAYDPRVEDLEFSYYSGEHVDLSPLLREQVILSVPIRPLCEESCRGLCAGCGANLNSESCRCHTQPERSEADSGAHF
jgi:uncharacterized protein